MSGQPTGDTTAGSGAARGARPSPALSPSPSPSPVGAADAFGLLYGRHAPALVRQTFLLCGGRGLSRRSVVHAFRLAWRRWPRVAVDADPAGWVRAEAHRHALAPWRHVRPVRFVRRVRAMRHVPPRDRALLDALLRLPRAYRGPLLLHDGLGLSLGDTAAEVEAGTAATAGRLRHARAALAARVPELRDAEAAGPEELARVTALLVRELAAPQPVRLPPSRRARRSAEIRSWCGTAGALGVTVAVAVAAVALVASDEERNPPPLPVPKAPSATLLPERQPGRLRPAADDAAARTRQAPLALPAHADGPAPRRQFAGNGPVRGTSAGAS